MFKTKNSTFRVVKKDSQTTKFKLDTLKFFKHRYVRNAFSDNCFKKLIHVLKPILEQSDIKRMLIYSFLT